MTRTSTFRAFAVLGLCALGLSSAAFACDDPNCKDPNCDHKESSSTTATAAPLPAGTRASLEVSGMHCADCASSVQAALMGVKGVKGANVDVTTGKADIAYDDKATNVDALISAVNATGHYQAKVAAPASTSQQ